MNCRAERKKLLLGGDIAYLLQLQVSCLGNQRFEIHTACSGCMALELVHQVIPDLILLDLMMPDIKGDVVCRILKADARTGSIPIIVLGSNDEKDASKQALAAGADGLIFKPASKELLLSTIECYLGIKIRRYVRAEVFLAGTLTLDETEIATTIHSLSVRGAFIEVTEGEIIVGDLVELRFHLPGSEREIAVKDADVIWLGNIKGDGHYGMGIRFLDIPPESSFLIALYLEALLDKNVNEEHAVGRPNRIGTTSRQISGIQVLKEET